MHAIIRDRGRQYLVTSGETLLVDHIAGTEAGGEHVFDEVLVQGDTIGDPLVAGARVLATIDGHVKGPKIYVEKFKRRKDYRRRTGHRQVYTRITISKVD